MIKKYLAALSTTALIGVAPYALAASSTDLTVTGLITPSACTPTLSGSGIVDHGKFSAKDLKQTSETPLPSQTLKLSVNCESATVFRLKSIDNRPDSDSDAGESFGLGKINGDQRLGNFEGVLLASEADGVAVRPLVSRDNGATWHVSSYLRPKTLSAFGSPTTPPAPIAIKDLVTDLQVNTYIARADSLDLSNEVALDGSVTLEILY
ncbi:DUF1120 domain-containing protein [Pseudomonas sp. WJP1]|uniref:DUF1120 domain-containing protein n=1 Tax=Pseudomonas sp. WJP1 TaxID=2986947 RepID=UPI00234A4BD8|nr:DUF1120 domain-containing protein [Pseudomonas sp. WJP1]WCM50410.1 DUF1120 domain-containing protein [Pseudomonas sp. WJP1]